MKLKMKIVSVLIACVCAFAIAGCNGENTPNKPSGTPPDGNAVYDSGLPFDEPLKKAFNYCPSVFETENGDRYCYYCSNAVSGTIQDHIYVRKGVKNDSGGYEWGEKTLVLAPTAGKYDAFHCCDPSVIAGRFEYGGMQYRYLMAYTGNTSNVNNKVGLAVSNEPMSGWVKVENAFVSPLGASGEWGVGQPELLSIDKAGKVMLFYSVGSASTYVMAEKWDLSNLDSPVRLSQNSLTHRGLTDLNGNGGDVINNVGVAFDEELKRYYFVSDCHPYPTDGDPLFVSSAYRITYMSEQGEIGDLFAAQGTKRHYTLATVGEAETGFKRNSNCCIVRSPYGYVLNSREIETFYSMSDVCKEYEWTYRIHSQVHKVEE